MPAFCNGCQKVTPWRYFREFPDTGKEYRICRECDFKEYVPLEKPVGVHKIINGIRVIEVAPGQFQLEPGELARLEQVTENIGRLAVECALSGIDPRMCLK